MGAGAGWGPSWIALFCPRLPHASTPFWSAACASEWSSWVCQCRACATLLCAEAVVSQAIAPGSSFTPNMWLDTMDPLFERYQPSTEEAVALGSLLEAFSAGVKWSSEVCVHAAGG